MEGFKQFFEQTKEQEANIKATLKKLPISHRKLITKYDLKWHGDNTLKGDDDHIGVVNPKNKTITIAAPWNYGREYTFLHEIAHKVFEAFMTKEMFATWKKVLKSTKGEKMNQNAEELWCMGYANYFAKNKIVIHTHPEWEAFMKEFVRKTS
jgi:hypothetical protein